MHTIKTSFELILREALYPAGALPPRRLEPEPLRRLGGWLLRDLGVACSEHEEASERIVMLRASVEL